MHRSRMLLSSLVSSLTLLLVIAAPLGQAASAQKAETSAIDVDAPMMSLQEANPRTDAQLIDLATAWLEARAETRISHSIYQKGVKFFRVNHPQFYGNFFGHPYYASFDSEYVYMSRVRGLARTEADPRNELPGLFSCHPRWYDPAFGGRCEYQFAAFQFLLLPDGSLPSIASAPSLRNPKPVRLGENCHEEWCELLYDDFLRYDLSKNYGKRTARSSDPPEETRSPRPGKGEIPTASIDNKERPAPSEIARPVKPAQAPTRSIDLPDDVHASMRKTAFSLWQTEKVLRFRNQIEQKYSGSDLSAQARDEMASHLARTLVLEGRNGVRPQGRGLSRSTLGRSDRPAPRTSGLNRIPNGVDISDLKVPESPRSTPSGAGAPNLDPPERPRPNRPNVDPPAPERPANGGDNARTPDRKPEARTPDPPRPTEHEGPENSDGN